MTNDYYSFGAPMPSRGIEGKYRYGFNGKEKDDGVKGTGNSYDFGARIYDPRLGKFLSIDPDFKKFPSNSPYLFASNSPIIFVDKDGRFSIRNHYDITYNIALELGYSKEVADKMAYFASTYADHPKPSMFDFLFIINRGKDIKYGRFGVTYEGGIADATKNSQMDDPYYVRWHSMMTDEEERNGMTHEFAKERGKDFGWDAILTGSKNKDFGLQMQGIHALQDADAHDGATMGEHLNFADHILEAPYMTIHDCIGFSMEAEQYTNSGLTILGLLGTDQKVINSILEKNTYDGKVYIGMHGTSDENINKVRDALIEKGYKNIYLNSDTYRTNTTGQTE